MDGVEAITRCSNAPRSSGPGPDHLRHDHDIIRAVEAGTAAVLLKDAPRDELFRAVRATARGETVTCRNHYRPAVRQVARCTGRNTDRP